MDKVGAVALAVGGGVVNGLGYTVQRRALTQATITYIRNPLWWSGFALLVVAESLGGASFSFLPASVVVALGSCSVVANAFFAYVLNGETLTRQTLTGTACIVLGTVLVAVVTPPVPTLETPSDYVRVLSSPPSIVFHSVVVGFFLALLPFVARFRMYALALYAACISSVTVVWFRPLLHVVAGMHWDAFRTFLPYVSLGIVTFTGVLAAAYVEPMGLRRFRQSQWVPVHFVACVVAFGVAAEVVYQDWIQAAVDASAVVSLLTSLTLVVWGVYLV